MSGIFPASGVPANKALNTVDVDTVNCDDGELFYSTTRCQPRFDPASANAIISELLNVMDAAGIPYDCSRLDNLANAIQQGGCDYTGWFAAGADPTTVCEALLSISNFLKDAFGENPVVLRNPTFYVRPDGVAHPDINAQDDLTVANAWNGFATLLQDIQNRFYIIGSITIDALGTYDCNDFNTQWTPEVFSGVTAVLLKGDPANESALVFDIVTASVNNRVVKGFSSANGLTAMFQDLTVNYNAVYGIANDQAFAFRAADNGILQVFGKIRLTGFHDQSILAANPFNAYGGRIFFADMSESRDTMELIVDFDAGTTLRNLYLATGGGRIHFYDCKVTVRTPVTLSQAILYTSEAVGVFFGDIASGQLGIETLPQSLVAPHAIRVEQLGRVTRTSDFGGGATGFDNILTQAATRLGINRSGAGYVNDLAIDLYSNAFGAYGTELTSNSNVTVL